MRETVEGEHHARDCGGGAPCKGLWRGSTMQGTVEEGHHARDCGGGHHASGQLWKSLFDGGLFRGDQR